MFDFAGIVNEFETPLLHYVGRLLSSAREEAEDVVQEAFMRLHRQVERHGRASIRSLKTWLYRVAHNLTIDAVRKRKRDGKSRESILAQGQTGERRTVAVGDELGDLAHREACRIAMARLEALPEEEKEVILLRVVEGLTLREISEITEVSIGNIDYRVNKALRELASCLKTAGIV